MKKGAIIYITGERQTYADLSIKKAVADLNLKADKIEIISNEMGHFDISDAWWQLTVKGMQQIVCMAANFSKAGTLQLTGRELRLL